MERSVHKVCLISDEAKLDHIAHPHDSFDFYIDIFNNVAEKIDRAQNERQVDGGAPCQLITGRTIANDLSKQRTSL